MIENLTPWPAPPAQAPTERTTIAHVATISPPSFQWQKALENFAKLFASMSQFIRALSDAELRFMLECAEQATPTNCDCHTYDAAKFIEETCELELQVRAFNSAVKTDKK